MATINTDIAQKIDIVTRQHDTFVLTLTMGPGAPWASGPSNFRGGLRQLLRGKNTIITEHQSSHEFHLKYARSHSIKRTRLHQVCEVSFRICVCCERSRNLKIVMQAYARRRRSNAPEMVQ